MKKRILWLLCAAVISLALVQPLCACAAPLDPEAKASLTLHYQKDGKTFPDLDVEIHRVARANPDGTFELLEPYSGYPVNIHDITAQDQWKHAASTLSAYIVADRVAPDRQVKTGSDGTAAFADLETGLYLIREVLAENEDGTYLFNTFLIYLPTPQSDGSWQYEMEAIPKCTGYVPKGQYTVTKLWRDEGYQDLRPQEVTVDIYLDGVLYETQILNAGNNWTYTWYVSGEDPGSWTVVEREVPDRYKVRLQQNGSHFTITNTCSSGPVIPEIPETGDSRTVLPWILAMCVSGLVLLLLGIRSGRRK